MVALVVDPEGELEVLARGAGGGGGPGRSARGLGSGGTGTALRCRTMYNEVPIADLFNAASSQSGFCELCFYLGHPIGGQ